MNPIEALLQAAHGHTGLPMQIPMQHTGGPIGGAISAPEPPMAARQNVGGNDSQVAEHAAHALLTATASASDPALKAVFTQALAALHKYLAQDQKEHEQALSGKMSPRMMAKAHGVRG